MGLIPDQILDVIFTSKTSVMTLTLDFYTIKEKDRISVRKKKIILIWK
jgi:hypothetical protein